MTDGTDEGGGGTMRERRREGERGEARGEKYGERRKGEPRARVSCEEL